MNATDPLPGPAPRRVLVAGTSGSGKTTLAVAVAAVAGVPHVEIDALFHGPGWTPRPTFAADVAQLAARPGWVTEWLYDQARPILASVADLLVWLDLGRPLIMWQVARRTARRRFRREMLWNGNIEPPLHTFFTDPDHIVRWAWRTYPETRSRVLALATERLDLPVVRLTSHAEAHAWVAGPLRHLCAAHD